MFEKLEEMLNHANANVLRYALYKDGEISAHERVASYPCSNCYSISKNFTATAIGLAYDSGLLDIEDTVISFFHKELPDNCDDNLRLVKIKHLLTQTMGLSEGSLFETDRYTHGTDDFLHFALSARLPYMPGEKFVYSNSTFYILSCIVEKVSGMPMDMFLQKHLFAKMGITDYCWEHCPKGHTMGATGLYLPTGDMLKLGILYLNKGIWQNQRILSEQWVQMATTKVAGLAEIPTGFSFWLNQDGSYYGGGAYSQILIIRPSQNIVLAAHSFDNTNDILGILQDYLNSLD